MLTSFETNFDAVIAEILSLRSTDDTTIRTIAYFNPFVGYMKELGIYEDINPYGKAFNEYIVQAASERNIPAARVYLAMNGPNGDEDASDKGYISWDGVHLSDAGHRLVVELHRGLGYEALGP